ncbi:MAG: protein BatD, partial [Bacteroidales bacterium]|nr:protein BatD [Bacteroidales bacterium]
VNGANYRMGVLRKTILFPQRSGKLTIKGVGADVVVRQRVSGGGFFFDSYQNAKMSLSSPDLTVNVKALPDNAPGYFKGAVGNFNLSSKLSNDSIRVNDAVVYSFTISGTGNIKLIDEPLIQFPKEFEVYDPQVNLNLSKGDGEVKGSKTFEYTIIPRYPGNYNIGEIRFAYFDPVSATYKTLKSEAYKLHVYKMPGDTAGDYAKIYARGDVEYIGDEDIRFIYTGDFYPTKNNGFLIEKFWFWLVSAIPFLAFIAVIILLRKRIKESANQALLRTKKANKISRKRLKKAAVYMQENNREDFFKEIMTALWGYLGDKLSIPVVSLNKENISQELLQRNVDEEIISKFIEILEECEYAHFAPSEGKEQTSKIYNDAVEIINVFEQRLK